MIYPITPQQAYGRLTAQLDPIISAFNKLLGERAHTQSILITDKEITAIVGDRVTRTMMCAAALKFNDYGWQTSLGCRPDDVVYKASWRFEPKY